MRRNPARWRMACACLPGRVYERVFVHWRSSVVAVLVALALLLLWLGADEINALAATVTALAGLARALADGWQAVVGLPLVGWLLARRDGV